MGSMLPQAGRPVLMLHQRKYNCSQCGNDGNDDKNTDDEEYEQSSGVLRDSQ